MRPRVAALNLAALAVSAVLPGTGHAAPDFTAFQAEFRAAVARNDAAAVAAMTRLPFLFEGRKLDAAGFARQAWPQLFTPALRRCWARAAAVAEPGTTAERSITCKPYSLHFDADKGVWQLREFSADGE